MSPCDYRIRVVERVEALPADQWRTLTSGEPGLSLHLLQALSNGGDRIGPIVVFLAEDGDGVTAAALCQVVTCAKVRNPLDEYLFGRGALTAGALRCTTRPLLWFAQPLSIGRSVLFRQGLSNDAVRLVSAQLLNEIQATASTRGCGVAFRGIHHDDPLWPELLARGYLELSGPPTTRLDVQWRDLEGYVAHLGQRSRSAAKKAKYEIRKSLKSGVVIRQLPTSVGHALSLDSMVREHYRRKGGRETSDANLFWPRLVASRPDDLMIFEARRGDQLLGMAGLLRAGSVALAPWLGMTASDERQDFTYFNFFYHVAALAGDFGLRQVDFGPSAYEAKRQRGCSLVANPVHYRPRQYFGRALAGPYTRLHGWWYRRKFP